MMPQYCGGALRAAGPAPLLLLFMTGGESGHIGRLIRRPRLKNRASALVYFISPSFS